MKFLTRPFAIVLLAVAATPAVAQPVPAEADKLLWCASAFYWLAGTAADAGDTEEAAMYDRWSKRLLEIGSASLISSGFQPDTIEELVTRYDEAALVQLADNTAPHDIATCPALLGDWR